MCLTLAVGSILYVVIRLLAFGLLLGCWPGSPPTRASRQRAQERLTAPEPQREMSSSGVLHRAIEAPRKPIATN